MGPSVQTTVGMASRWLVSTWTGDLPSAGCDSNIKITVQGQSSRTEEKDLDNDEDNFERGRPDFFPKITMKDVGKPKKLIVRNENIGKSPGWYCVKIRLDNMDKDETYMFMCNDWLSESSSLIRELLPTE